MDRPSPPLPDPATTANAPPRFHLLAKPSGSTCNIDCNYCFFLSKEALYPNEKLRMSEATLSAYLRQLLESHRLPEVTVAWQGGEPTLMGVDFFRKSVALVHKGNIMKFTEGAFRNWGYQLAAELYDAKPIGAGPWCEEDAMLNGGAAAGSRGAEVLPLAIGTPGRPARSGSVSGDHRGAPYARSTNVKEQRRLERNHNRALRGVPMPLRRSAAWSMATPTVASWTMLNELASAVRTVMPPWNRSS